MITIGTHNTMQGNQAMASVLLLYYHLLRDGGFANDQTVYIDTAQFNGSDFLDTEVSTDCADEIDQQLLREGAVMYLLCDLQDVIGEHDDNFLSQPTAQKIIGLLDTDNVLSTVPEIHKILELLQASEENFDHTEFSSTLSMVFEMYVVSRFAALTQRVN